MVTTPEALGANNTMTDLNVQHVTVPITGNPRDTGDPLWTIREMPSLLEKTAARGEDEPGSVELQGVDFCYLAKFEKKCVDVIDPGA